MIASKQCGIETATVAVKVVTLNDKQMTLSVFRQIPMGSVLEKYGWRIARDITLWGRVNYFWPDNEEEIVFNGVLIKCRLHILFEKHGMLYRDLISKAAPESLNNACRKLSESITAEHDDDAVHSILKQQETLRREWYNTIVPALERLPQLFIAI